MPINAPGPVPTSAPTGKKRALYSTGSQRTTASSRSMPPPT